MSAGLIAVFALMLRVLTAPLKLSPERVKVPMVAMVLSCLSLGTAPIAASMAIDRPEAIDDAPTPGLPRRLRRGMGLRAAA